MACEDRQDLFFPGVFLILGIYKTLSTGHQRHSGSTMHRFICLVVAFLLDEDLYLGPAWAHRTEWQARSQLGNCKQLLSTPETNLLRQERNASHVQGPCAGWFHVYRPQNSAELNVIVSQTPEHCRSASSPIGSSSLEQDAASYLVFMDRLVLLKCDSHSICFIYCEELSGFSVDYSVESHPQVMNSGSLQHCLIRQPPIASDTVSLIKELHCQTCTNLESKHLLSLPYQWSLFYNSPSTSWVCHV